MATAAQIEANTRNAQKSSGPRTEEGKKRSRCNALDHGCRANMMVLPTEVFGEYEHELHAWVSSLKPRNPTEEFLVTRMAKLAWQGKRIDRAQTARLSTRIHQGEMEEDDAEAGQVIELGQKLFRDACGPIALHLQNGTGDLCPDGDNFRISDYSDDEDQPMRLVHCLQTTRAGCQWLLDGWAELTALLEKGVPWLASDKLKAVRLLGRHPIDALDHEDVARVYLASHVLLMKQDGEPFQEIINELSPEEAVVYRESLCLRQYDLLKPKDPAAAREVLVEIVNRAVERVRSKADVLDELAELNAPFTAGRLSWDDTAEGERSAPLRSDVRSGVGPGIRLVHEDSQNGRRAGLGDDRQTRPFLAARRIRQDRSIGVDRCKRHHRTGGSCCAARSAERSQIRDRKSRRTKPILVCGRPAGTSGWTEGIENGYAAPRPQGSQSRDHRQEEEPSGARPGNRRPEFEPHGPVVDL